MKKLIALFVAFVFVFSVLPVQAVAEEIMKEQIKAPDPVEYNPFGTGEVNKSRGAKSTTNTVPLSGKLYDQLDDEQKYVYDQLVAADVSASSIHVTFKTALNTTGSNYNNLLAGLVYTALHAAMRDYPDRFWINQYGMGFSGSDYSYTGSGYKFFGVSVNLWFYDAYNSSNLPSIHAQLMDAVDSFRVAGATRYEKLRSIHDYLVNTATYDPNVNTSSESPYAHQPNGCLLSPYICVCQGYATAFKLIADKAGIPNMLVSSPSHIWNVVLMEDNQWYAIDCTWDDPSITGSSTTHLLRYIYFLVGSQTKPDGSTQFSQESSHTEEIYYSDSAGNTLLNPVLSTTSYAPFYPKETWSYNNEQNNDCPGGSIFKSNMLVFITPGRTVSNSFTTLSSVGSFTSTGNKTGATLTFTPKSGSGSVYTVIMRGDINKDGSVNNTDMTYISDISVGTRTYSSTAPETYAGDINGDGIVDGFDFALLDRYQGGSYSFY